MSNSDKDTTVISPEIEQIENQEWLDSLDYALRIIAFSNSLVRGR